MQNFVTPFSREFAQELLAIYGSPLYVYDGNILRETINHITQSIAYPHKQFQFATVTNGNVSLLQIFRQCEWGLHANTPGDAFLGLKAGFYPGKIVYSGSNLNAKEFAELLDWGVTTFNLDCVAQLQLFCDIYIDKFAEKSTEETKPKLGLRLNLPELTGDSRIGVRPEEFSEVIKITNSVGLKLSSLHFYRGTGTNSTKAFTQVIEPILGICQLLPDWEYLDFGGGFGYPYHHNGVAFDWQTFGRELTAAIEKLDKKIQLIIEPGRAAIAGSGKLLTKVISVKWQEDKQIVGVDTTVANLSVPSVHGGYREIVSFLEVNKSDLYLTDVCGNTTYSRDYLGKNCQLPSLKEGDILAILDTGAYGYVMSSHFLHRPRPAEILLEKNQHRLIRQREDYNILLNGQIFS
ncbi:diaminopimelate decarboxylase family protein [Dapis sp. BLCC M126]|uniref:diaminopimelate decarboxylase family protein n=1 Tax=Dapis sp. BLCC M126 TaxID=3400189 RepID=UPI003CF6AF4B